MVTKAPGSVRRALLVAFLLQLGAGVLFAQKVPRPEEVLGFKVGADFHLATYEQASSTSGRSSRRRR